jgi:putative copper resistance protein D
VLVDVLAVALRALSFIAILQAAGLVLFSTVFAQPVMENQPLVDFIRHLIRRSALVGILLVLATQVLEAGRMAGELRGVLDMDLQRLAWVSANGQSAAMRVIGLFLMAATSNTGKTTVSRYAWLGAMLVCGAFLLTGHTSISDSRLCLAPLLGIHLLIVAWWFGALLPLYFASRHAAPGVAAELVAAFSARAVWLVPLIALAGLLMAIVLLPDWNALLEPYGLLLITKVLGFVVLMSCAALNKWRFGPALRRDEMSARRAFQHVVLIEYGLITTVIVVTAVMTGWYSPD